MSVPKTRSIHTRRAVLRATLGTGASVTGGAILAACGGETIPTITPVASAPTTAPAVTATRAATTAASPAGSAATTAATTVATAAVNAAPTVAPTIAPTIVPMPVSSAAPITATTAAVAPGTPDKDGIVHSAIPGVPDLYTKPIAPFKAIPQVPGRGGKVTSFHITYGNPPLPPRNENLYWQELEKRLGVTLEPTVAPVGSYQEKLATLTASGDIPDLTLLVLASAPEQNKSIQQGAYTDLTPYLGGDARKEFPYLAAIPDRFWQGATFRGKIYGVPRPTTLVANTLVFRQDWAEKLGTAQAKNAGDFARLLGDFVNKDPDGNGKPDTFALGAAGSTWCLPFFQTMFRVPNNWRKNADGTLTSAIETEEYRASVAYARMLFTAGIFHPDAATMNTTQAKQAFAAGKIGGYNDGTGGVADFRIGGRFAIPAPANAVGLVPVGFDGGKATTYNGSGVIGFVGIPAKVGKDKERVRELLRICDYFCAPYGSEEKIFLDQGIVDVHYTLNADGTRTTNERLGRERGDLANLTKAPLVAANPIYPDEAVRQFKLYEGLQGLAIDDPTLVAYAPTYAGKAGELGQLERDRVGAIIQGRDPLSALDQFVKDWRARGGDQIRKEYEIDLKG